MSMMRTFATIAFIVAAVGLSQSLNAQTGAAAQKPPQGDVCWQNAATGQPVPNENLVPNGATQDRTDPDNASVTTSATIEADNPLNPTGNPAPQTHTTVINYVRGADGSWSNAATGQPVPNENLVPNGATQDRTDPDNASVTTSATIEADNPLNPTGNPAPQTHTTIINYVRVPCPPTQTTTPPTSVALGPTPSVPPSGSPFWWQVDGAVAFTMPTGVIPCSTELALNSTVTCSGNVRPIGFDVGGGIGITPYFGVNFAYNHSSDVTRNASAPTTSLFGLTDSGTFQLQYEDLTARGIIPIHGWLSLYGEGGVAFWQTSGQDVQNGQGIMIVGTMTMPYTFATTTLYNFSGASPVVGGGFDFRLYKGLRAGVEFEHFQAKDGALDEHNNELKFRMTYRFGHVK
jgi:hypothetical protein